MVPAMPAFECNEGVLRVGGDADIATRRIEIIDSFLKLDVDFSIDKSLQLYSIS